MYALAKRVAAGARPGRPDDTTRRSRHDRARDVAHRRTVSRRWAHGAHPELESFVTPWHAVFYSGFTAITAWTGLLAWSRRAPGRPAERSLPAGYAPDAAGILVFSFSGLGDLVWHQTLGIE